MDNYSFSTVLMAVLTSNLIIITIALCFIRREILLSIGYKVLIVFLVLTIIRFAVPFELSISTNIYLPEFLAVFISYFRYVFFRPYGIKISLWTFFEIVWGVGVIYNIIKQSHDTLALDRFINVWCEEVTEKEPFHSLLTEICSPHKNRYRVFIVPNITSPCLYGILKPRILIPTGMTMSNEDWYYVLRHEISHHYHRDLVMKRIVGILCIVYWWNPACSTLRKQVDVLLEMRIDDSLVRGNSETARAYMATLIKIVERTEETPSTSLNMTVSLSPQNEDALIQRFEMVSDQKASANIFLKIGMFTLIIAMYLGSYLFTFENYYLIEGETREDVANTKEILYAVPKNDGTYDVYYGDFLIENVESLDYYPGIPVYSQ